MNGDNKVRDVTAGEIRTINFLLGDISDLTPSQKEDILLWVRGEVKGSRDDSLSDKLLHVLKRCRNLTVAVAKNRTRNKYSEKEIIDAFSSLESKGLVVIGKTKIGKDLYSIAGANK